MELANSIVTLQPGMYILRHPKTGMPPISLSRAAANAQHNGHIQAIFTPGTQGSVLRDGRDCIVMHVLDAPADLLVTAYLDKTGAAVPALKIDKIRLGNDETAAQSLQVPSKGITLIGHIESRGDVIAKEGTTLGLPATELRIEGFQVMWPDKPEGVDLAYSAIIESAGESPTVTTGGFCGTRNAARRLVSVKFGLTGPNSGDYALSGKANFSGGYVEDVVNGALIAGPTGMEHLTALTLKVRRTTGWDPSHKTKVFKRKNG